MFRIARTRRFALEGLFPFSIDKQTRLGLWLGNENDELQLVPIPYHVAKFLRNETTSPVMAFNKDSPFSAVAC